MIRILSIWSVVDALEDQVNGLLSHYAEECIAWPYPVDGILDQDLLIFGENLITSPPEGSPKDGRYVVLQDMGTYDGDAHAFMREHPRDDHPAFFGQATLQDGKVMFVGHGSKLFKTVTRGIMLRGDHQIDDGDVEDPTWWAVEHNGEGAGHG